MDNGFEVERLGDGSSGWANVGSVGANSTTFANPGLAASTRYFHRIRAKNAAGTSGWSETVNATTQAPPLNRPNTPTNLKITAAADGRQLTVSWASIC